MNCLPGWPTAEPLPITARRCRSLLPDNSFRLVDTRPLALLVAALGITVLFGAGCSDRPEVVGPAEINASHAEASELNSTLFIDRVLLNVEEVEIEGDDSPDFTQDTPLMAEWRGPVGVVNITEADLDPGNYPKVKIKIAPGENSEGGLMDGASVRVEGRIGSGATRRNFVFSSRIHHQYKIEPPQPFAATDLEAERHVIGLVANAYEWFWNETGAFLDPDDPSAQTEIKANILAGVRAFVGRTISGVEMINSESNRFPLFMAARGWFIAPEVEEQTIKSVVLGSIEGGLWIQVDAAGRPTAVTDGRSVVRYSNWKESTVDLFVHRADGTTLELPRTTIPKRFQGLVLPSTSDATVNLISADKSAVFQDAWFASLRTVLAGSGVALCLETVKGFWTGACIAVELAGLAAEEHPELNSNYTQTLHRYIEDFGFAGSLISCATAPGVGCLTLLIPVAETGIEAYRDRVLFPIEHTLAGRIAFEAGGGIMLKYLGQAEALKAFVLAPSGEPRWSPFGRHLLYRAADPSSGSMSLFVRWHDGSTEQITSAPPGQDDGDARWSPRGDWVAFTRAPQGAGPGQNSVVGLVRPDGTDFRVLGSNLAPGRYHRPYWADNGTDLLIENGEAGVLSCRVDENACITLVPPWSTSFLKASHPCFAGKGDWIVFGGETHDIGDYDIWVVKPDGSGSNIINAFNDDWIDIPVACSRAEGSSRVVVEGSRPDRDIHRVVFATITEDGQTTFESLFGPQGGVMPGFELWERGYWTVDHAGWSSRGTFLAVEQHVPEVRPKVLAVDVVTKERYTIGEGINPAWAPNPLSSHEPPDVGILAPIDGAVFQEGMPIHFQAYAVGSSGAAVARIVWAVDQEVIRIGNDFEYALLETGDHTVTVTATDYLRSSATISIEIKVQPTTEPPPQPAYSVMAVGRTGGCATPRDLSAATQCWGAGTVNGWDPTSPPAGCEDTGCSNVPTALPSGHHFVNTAVGYDHACGIDAGNDMYCWGDNRIGELGTPSPTFTHEPIPVTPPVGVQYVDVGLGFATLGVTSALGDDGQIYSWGNGNFGRFGDGIYASEYSSTDPVRASTDHISTNVVWGALAVGGFHTCALIASPAALAGQAYCWGFNNVGQLGVGDANHRAEPTLVLGDQRFVELSAGLLHTCGVTATGAVYCWGSNDGGELGIGAVGTRAFAPTPVADARSFSSVVTGALATCAVSAGDLFCWGKNTDGVLGVDETPVGSIQWTPPTVATLLGVVHPALRWQTACALTGSSIEPNAYCWGNNYSGQTGTGLEEPYLTTPTPLADPWSR